MWTETNHTHTHRSYKVFVRGRSVTHFTQYLRIQAEVQLKNTRKITPVHLQNMVFLQSNNDMIIFGPPTLPTGNDEAPQITED